MSVPDTSAEALALHLSFFVPSGFALMAQAEIDRVHNESEALRVERDAARHKLRSVLRRISEMGAVCETFTECDHRACRDSSAACLLALSELELLEQEADGGEHG